MYIINELVVVFIVEDRWYILKVGVEVIVFYVIRVVIELIDGVIWE